MFVIWPAGRALCAQDTENHRRDRPPRIQSVRVAKDLSGQLSSRNSVTWQAAHCSRGSGQDRRSPADVALAQPLQQSNICRAAKPHSQRRMVALRRELRPGPLVKVTLRNSVDDRPVELLQCRSK